ncbi:LALA0S05e00386g1_1 [Lachancea lanzarotensis]|uniref:LALA0S05e00386g1_1 n=1 Tax=Lachancea lanzarotensis TaxID=1245769 RepID=A0A0C7N2J9_9SACH|nr:uncharacterized protein LALA0_S05e00386g [Lachancea lanzarotensis]CEP62213.1 LALA0S05e00386g1_1 [Lachancea lanzarotensis]
MLRIFYFQNKFELEKIAIDEELKLFKAQIEFIKIRNFDQLQKYVFTKYTKNHTIGYLVYNKNKLFLHSIGLPIVLKYPLKMDEESIFTIILGIINGRMSPIDTILNYNKKKDCENQNRILVFSINSKISIQIEKVKFVEIRETSNIYKEIFRYDFTRYYNPNYLIIENNKIMKKSIYERFDFFEVPEEKCLEKLVLTL